MSLQEELLLASRGQGPGMLLNILMCKTAPSPPENYLFPKVSSAQNERSCCYLVTVHVYVTSTQANEDTLKLVVRGLETGFQKTLDFTPT